MEKIPCTIAILTHNSAGTLSRALASASSFAEIIICDGSSTDDTRAIAQEAGARILEQDPVYLYPDGRISDFAGVRNQTLQAATQPWYFFLDSDEYLSDELAAAIREACTGDAGAYWILRKYVVSGRMVECATTYPNRSMRFFARASVEGFVKKIHERIELKEGVVPGQLDAPLCVPLELDPAGNRTKDTHYIGIEVKRLLASPDPFLQVFWRAVRFNVRASMIYGLRLIRIIFFCRGTRLPLWEEMGRHRYHIQLLGELWRRRHERG